MDTYWKKIKWIWAAVIVAVSLAAGLWSAHNQGSHIFQSVRQLGENQDYIYGLDEDSENYYLFRIRKDGSSQELFQVPMEQNDGIISLTDWVMDSQGNMYVMEMTTGTESKKSISYCDFQSGTLEEMWDISSLEQGGQWYFILQISDDDRIYLALDSDSIFTWYELLPDKTAKLYQEIPISQNIYEIETGRDLGLWGLDREGNIYKIGKNGEESRFFKNDGTQIGHDNVAKIFENDRVYVYSLSEERYYKITAFQDIGKAEPCDKTEIRASSARIVELGDGREVIGITRTDGTEQVIDRISTGEQWQKLAFLKTAGFCMGAGFVYFALFLLLRGKKGRAPLWGNMVLVIIPIIAIGYGLLFNQTIDRQMKNSNENARAVRLARANRDFLMDIDMEKFKAYREADVHTERKGRELELDSGYEEIYWEGNGGALETRIDREGAYPSLYFYKNGIITSADAPYQMNISIEYISDPDIYEAMLQAAEQKKAVYLEYNDGLNDYSSVFTPIEDEGGNVIGLLEASIGSQEDMLDNVLSRRNIKRQITITGLGILAVVLAVIWLNMRPLEMLRTGVTRLIDGKLDARVNIRGKSEIAGIATAFNTIAENVETQVEEMESLQKKYAAFIPKGLFELFRKRGIQKISPGVQTGVRAAVLALNTSGIGEDQTDMFSYINQCLSTEIPVLEEKGGVVFRFFEAGTESLFPGDREGAVLSAAVTAVQKSRKMPDRFHLYGGIAIGRIKLGILGSETRYMAEVLEEDKSLSWFLQKLASDCRADILITSQAVRRIQDFQTGYWSRILGYIYIKEQDHLELVYEVMTGADEEARRKKMAVKERFEEGVSCFMAGQIQKARRHFIEVIEYNKDDKGAIIYIRLCEELMEKGQEQGTLCLKVF